MQYHLKNGSSLLIVLLFMNISILLVLSMQSLLNQAVLFCSQREKHLYYYYIAKGIVSIGKTYILRNKSSFISLQKNNFLFKDKSFEFLPSSLAVDLFITHHNNFLQINAQIKEKDAILCLLQDIVEII